MAVGYVRVGGILYPIGGMFIQEECEDTLDEFEDVLIETDVQNLTYDIDIGDSVTISYDTDFSDNTPTVTIL